MDGVEVIRGLRGWTTVPIIVLSARTAEQQKVSALDAGANDFVTKTFGMDELMARLRVALRAPAPGGGPPSSGHLTSRSTSPTGACGGRAGTSASPTSMAEARAKQSIERVSRKIELLPS